MVVDDLNFHTVLNGERRLRPGQMDRHKSLLRDAPKKLSYRMGAKNAAPACLSVHLELPWQELGPRVDFNPRKGRHPDLQVHANQFPTDC